MREGERERERERMFVHYVWKHKSEFELIMRGEGIHRNEKKPLTTENKTLWQHKDNIHI